MADTDCEYPVIVQLVTEEKDSNTFRIKLGSSPFDNMVLIELVEKLCGFLLGSLAL